MSERMTKYSTRLPDERMLEVVPSDPPAYRLDGAEVSEEEAQAAWEAQDAYWQRGRTLQQALAFWMGRTG